MALTDGLVGLWHMNNDWLDSSGSNDGTASGATFSASAKLGSHAGSFDGIDDEVSMGDNANFELQTFTIGVWVKRGSSGTHDSIVHLNGNSRTIGGLAGVYFQYRNTDTIRAQFILDPNIVEEVQTSATYTDTDWRYLIVTKTGTAVKIYRDNVEVASGTLSSATIDYTSPTKQTLFGSQGYDTGNLNPLDGLLDEVAVWNRVITSGEMTELWNGGAGIEITPSAFNPAWALKHSSGMIGGR